MAFEALLNRIRQIKQNLINDRENEALRISFDQLALTKLRIQTKGQNSNEQPFAPYVPAYAKDRQKAGYQVGYVDFTRTGRMFAAVRPRVESSTVFSATVVIEGTDQRSRDIIAGAAKKRGNILLPSKAEIELTRQANRQRILKAFQQ
jgi:hypothetical protein